MKFFEDVFALSLGGDAYGPSFLGKYEDFSSYGPGGLNYSFTKQKNIEIGVKVDQKRQSMLKPGPGEIGFKYIEQMNLVPLQGVKGKKEKKK